MIKQFFILLFSLLVFANNAFAGHGVIPYGNLQVISGVEICNNATDDDSDGNIDCADSDCYGDCTLHSSVSSWTPTGQQIKQNAATTNYSGQTYMEITLWATNDQTNSLLRFDLSSLPNGAYITSAEIALWRNNDSPASYPISIYRLLVPFVANQTTWNIRSTGNNWDTSGAMSSGIDHATTATDTVTPSATPYDQSVAFNVTVDVQLFSNGISNYGWVLLPNPGDFSESQRFEALTATLTVSYYVYE